MSVEQWCVRALDGVARGSAFDIGANAGSWTVMLSQLFDRVIAVEPDPRALLALREAAGELESVVVVNAAVRSKRGSCTLYQRAEALQSSLLEESPIGGDGAVPCPPTSTATVECITLDDVAKHAPDFVKMDIEGSEADALSLIEKKRWEKTTFLVECHATVDEVTEHLERLGKTVERIPHPNGANAHPQHCWVIGRPAA